MTTSDLVAAYKQAQMDVLEAIRDKERLGSPTEYEEQLILEIDQVLQSLGVDNRQWIRENVPILYSQTSQATEKQLSFMERPAVAGSFAGINQQAVAVIVSNSTGDFEQALYEVGRRINDQVRTAGIEAAKKGFTSGRTVREIARELEQTLADQGCALGVPDSKGRIQPVDAYAEMAARTITRETTNTATMNTAHEYDCHLFKMSRHFPTCKLCAPRQDRVYRDIDFPAGDERNRFPHISQAFPGWPTYKTVHPRCRHVIVAIAWDALSRETQLKYLADAGKPFDLDPRSEMEIAAYNKGQALLREMREDRKQWQRYQARLGEDAPKTFQAFRRMKKADGEKWRLLELDYRRRNRLANNPELALPGSSKTYIEDAKFTGYLFGGTNSEGLSKGVAYRSHLGYNSSNWEDMRQEIAVKASQYPVRYVGETQNGSKYEQLMILYGPKRNPMNVTVPWEVKDGVPRMITVVPSRKEEQQ